ncbi:unnamed protein product [Dovyalis caffra]|uniref:Alpha/beta hydrolase fold-3 domain-containing protein n=1 Tax=Dovyalis caffra TaxID=77055 RepID=A0AAV1R8C0_9ROSI|nr:unnamed protein product [Dovyalis caffra]
MSNKTTTATAAEQPYEVDECLGVLRVYSDGSIWRSSEPNIKVPVHDDSSVVWKDALFDSTHDLHLRLPASPSSTKLPVFYYFHGGGFCIGFRAWPSSQNYCIKLALDLQAVIISPDHRLAPENQLPAVIDDGYMAVKWLQALAVSEEPDTWLTAVADFSKVFISDYSAGGNIAHNLAVRLGAGSPELASILVKGYVLLVPFFGGTTKTKSEAEDLKESLLNWELIDRFWRLSIPVGNTTDHPLVNPFGAQSQSLEPLDFDPILVAMGGSDLVKDRANDYAKRLQNSGKEIHYAEFEGWQHCFQYAPRDVPEDIEAISHGVIGSLMRISSCVKSI